MAYGKFVARMLFSDNSDYSNPSQDTGSRAVVSTPVESQLFETDVQTAAKTLVGAGEWASCDCLYVENLETSGGNYVTVGFTDTTTGAKSVDVPAGGSFHTTNVDPSAAVQIVADTAACRCLIGIMGTA